MSILHKYWIRCWTLVWDVYIIIHGCYHWMSCHVLIKPFLFSLIPPEVLILYQLSLFIIYVFYIVGLSCTETWSVALWYQSDSSYNWTCVADYVWVEGDLCEVAMELLNPLPFELKVQNMVSTVSVTTLMLHDGDMVWIHVVWCLTCLYCGAFLPTVLFWSCTISFFSLVMDEEDFTSRLFRNWLQRLCHRKLHVMARHFLNNHICWQNVYLMKDGVCNSCAWRHLNITRFN
jgi:hypothetical protein